MKFDIINRFTGAVMFTAEIECDNKTSHSFKLGLAVKAAVKAGADLRGAYLSSADLRGADLRGAYLRDADLMEAILSGANLHNAILSGANLHNANISGAIIRDANISGAYLTGANLHDAHISGAYQITRIVARATRSDNFEFFGFELTSGGIFIRAGCHSMTLTEYRAHIASKYPDTPKARETTYILDFIEKRAEARP